VGAVVAVVIIVLSVLLLTGVFSPAGSGGYPHGPLRYSVAHGQVSSATSSYRGGGWKVFEAIGLAAPVAISGSMFSTTNLTVPGCNTTVLLSSTSQLNAPANNASLDSGIAPVWTFLLLNAANSLLVVLDINGTVTPILEVTGSSSACPLSQISAVATGVPSNAIDSDRAAQIAWQAGGRAFVAANPTASAVFGVTTGINAYGLFTLPSEWSVAFRACTAAQIGTGAIVPTFNATINAETGALIYAANSTSSCLSAAGLGGYTGTSPPPLGTVLGFGAVTSFTYGGALTGYRIPIASVAGTVHWSDLGFTLVNASGALLFPASGNITAVDVAGAAIAVYSFTTGAWSGNSGASLSSVDALDLYPPGTLDLHGGQLQAVAVSGTYAGTVAAFLP
jgi:hypothetical protein